MRELLIGYLLDALEPAEHEVVSAQLSQDPQLRNELALLKRSLEPLAADKGHFIPPAGLAHRTCEFVARQTQVAPAEPVGGAARGRWTFADLAVAAGIFLAAATLFFPAVNQSRFAARLQNCQNNLREVGAALTNYSDAHDGYFPNPPTDGRLAVAGIYAVMLNEHGFLPNSHVLLCPASTLAEHPGDFRVPTAKELKQCHQRQLARWHQLMGGSYGYNLGYMADGQYRPTKNLHRETFAIVADAPTLQAPYFSSNHGGCGQNVLFEDGHVQYLNACSAQGCDDNIYLNDRGEMAPGLHVHDAVIGPSEARLLIVPLTHPDAVPAR